MAWDLTKFVICSMFLVFSSANEECTTQGTNCAQNQTKLICPEDFQKNETDTIMCKFVIINPQKIKSQLSVVDWKDGTVQHINVELKKTKTSMQAMTQSRTFTADLLLAYTKDDGPYNYISWRADFKVYSLGLLDDYANPILEIQMEEPETTCLMNETKEVKEKGIMISVYRMLQEVNILSSPDDYENIKLCFLKRFKWFDDNKPLYIMKRHFGIPLQEFGYECCTIINEMLCCGRKMQNGQGYRKIPYVVAVMLFVFVVPFVLLKIGYCFDLSDQQCAEEFNENWISVNCKSPALFGFISEWSTSNRESERSNEKCCERISLRWKRFVFLLISPLFIYMELVLFAAYKPWKHIGEDLVESHALLGFTSLLIDYKNNDFLPLGGPFWTLLIYYFCGLLLLVCPSNFDDILEKGTNWTHFKMLNDLHPTPDSDSRIRGYRKVSRVLSSGLFLVWRGRFWRDVLSKKKFYYIGLLLFSFPILTFFFIVLAGWTYVIYAFFYNDTRSAENSNSTVSVPVDENSCLLTNENRTPKRKYIKILHVLVYFGFIVLFLFALYQFVNIISYSCNVIIYTFYFLILAFLESPEKATNLILFSSFGIIFLYQRLTKLSHYYKKIFNITVNECENKYATTFIKTSNNDEYVRKDVVLHVQNACHPVVFEVGHTFWKIFVVVVLYVFAYLVFIEVDNGVPDYTNNLSSVFIAITPIIVQFVFRKDYTDKYKIGRIVKKYSTSLENSQQSIANAEEEGASSGIENHLVEMDRFETFEHS